MNPNRLLYYSPAVRGGLADYAREQANAIARLDVEVEILSSAEFPISPGDLYALKPDLVTSKPARTRWTSRLASFQSILRNHRRLAQRIEDGDYHHVLFGSYAEYLAPLWCRPLHRRDVVFGAVVHDPVRDYRVGPRWWHRRSIACAYSFLREAFVHEPIVLDTVRRVPGLRTTVIPHGPFTFPPATATRSETRSKLGIPEDATVWLSFGHVRDGKNLDLAIRALVSFPDAILLVAGKEQSQGQKPVAFYRELARRLGVAARCVWVEGFIPAEEVANLFVACDLVLLTYGRNFRSASGVLNTAVSFRKPCLASSGQGNLQTVISKYDLGLWIQPDDAETLVAGIRRWREVPPAPRWEDYLADHSWRQNAEIVRDRMFEP